MGQDHPECKWCGAPVNVSSYLTNGNQTFVMVPLGALSANTVYTVKVAGVTDMSGNAMTAPVTTTFTSSAAVDFTQPTVTQVDPAYNSTSIPTNVVIKLRFNKQVVLSVSEHGILVPYNASSVVLPGTVVVAGDGLSATFTLPRPCSRTRNTRCIRRGSRICWGRDWRRMEANVSVFRDGRGDADGTADGDLGAYAATGATNVPVNAVIRGPGERGSEHGERRERGEQCAYAESREK